MSFQDIPQQIPTVTLHVEGRDIPVTLFVRRNSIAIQQNCPRDGISKVGHWSYEEARVIARKILEVVGDG